MNKLNNTLLSIVIGLAFAFVACSGGGGGGDSGGATSGLSYSGVTTEAQVEESNATEISLGALEAGPTDVIGDGLVGLSVDQQIEPYPMRNFRSVKLPLILSDSLDMVDFSSASSFDINAATQSASDIINGSCGGTMSYSVSFDDVHGIFSGSFTFSNYCNDGTTINGAARFDGQMDVDTQAFIEATFSFDNLTGGDLAIDGTIHIDFTTSPRIFTFNAYCQNPITGVVVWIQNYSITIDEFADHAVVEMGGRFYHPDFGYVTLTTPVALVLYSGEEWPDSGTLEVAGANGSKAKLTAIDNLTCTVEVDGNGDGTYEWDSGVMNWEDL